ncbi:MAG TPA: hypothetical protein VF662_09595 [Allosphingosinicella sp.]
MGVSYSHRNGKCHRVENYRDGCTRKTVKDLRTGRIERDRTTRGTGHKNW